MFLLILVGLDPLHGRPARRLSAPSRRGSACCPTSRAWDAACIDLRDVIYFLSLGGDFPGPGLRRAAEPEARAGNGGALRRLRLGVGMLAASLVVVNLLGGYIGGRLDLYAGEGLHPLARARGAIAAATWTTW